MPRLPHNSEGRKILLHKSKLLVIDLVEASVYMWILYFLTSLCIRRITNYLLLQKIHILVVVIMNHFCILDPIRSMISLRNIQCTKLVQRIMKRKLFLSPDGTVLMLCILFLLSIFLPNHAFLFHLFRYNDCMTADGVRWFQTEIRE